MRRFQMIVCCMVLSALFLTGCGKGLSKLTDEQKTKLSQTLESAGRAQKAVPRGNGGSESSTRLIHRSAALTWVSSPSGPEDNNKASAPASQDEAEMKMQSRLESSSKEKICDIVFETSEPTPSTKARSPIEAGSITIKVSGESCPLTMDLFVAMKVEEKKASVDLGCKYKVKDAEYLALNDVDAMDIKGGFTFTSEKSDFSGKGTVTLDLGGTLHSQKNGDVAIKLTGKIEGTADKSSSEQMPSDAKGEVVTRIDFSDFSVELKQTIEGKTNKYYINEEEVTQKEFEDYFKKADLVTGNTESGSSSSDEKQT